MGSTYLRGRFFTGKGLCGPRHDVLERYLSSPICRAPVFTEYPEQDIGILAFQFGGTLSLGFLPN